MTSFVVIYDACALFPNTQRDLLIRVAQEGLVQAKWTHRILDEMERALRAKRSVDDSKLERLRQLINNSVRDSIVEGYQPLEAALDLPDPGDLHVLAAAVKAGAQVIVTDNLKDFPEDRLAPWSIQAKTPDEFLLDQLSLDRDVVYGSVVRIADSRNNPPQSINDVLNQLERNGLARTVAELRRKP